MKNKFLKVLAGAAVALAVQAQAATTGKTLPTEPYVVDGYTPDTRSSEAKETYANRVVKSDVEGNNHSVFGQDNTVLAEHGSSSNFGNQNEIGVNAKDGNIFGDGSSITGLQAQAYGDNNHLKGEQNSAFGMNNIVTGDHTHAIGGGNNVTGSRATAVGHYNLITSDEATAVGYDNKAHVRGVAVGYTNNATNHGVAIGVETKATGESSTAIGVHTTSDGLSTIAIGSNAAAHNKASTAIGQGAVADASYGVALGKAAQANHGSAVALGTAAVTEQAVSVNEATVGKITYGGFAGTDATAVVSVGAKGDHTRQIINVGAGEISATSTDAINGSQLYATNDVINNVAGSVVNVLGGNAALDNKGNITMIDIGGTGENTVHDAIKSHTDKIKANADNIAGNTRNIATNTADIRAAEALIDKNAKDIADNAQRITTNEGNIASNTAYIKAVEDKLPEVQAGDNTTVNVTVDANGKATYTVSSKDYQPAIDKVTAKADKNAKAIEANAKITENQWNVVLNNRKLATANKEKLAEVADELEYQTQFIRQNSEAIIQTQKATTAALKASSANTQAIRKLDRDVRKNRKRADAGTASVAAMANIPQVYLSGKSGIGVGVGHKHGQSALAVGYSRTSDNAHHIIKLSVGIDTQKDVTVGAGYMYQY